MKPQLNIPRADLLRAAIAGYQIEIKRLNGVVAGLYRELEGKDPHAPTLVSRAWKALKPKQRAPLSAAAIARISAAQKKRWRIFHKAHQKAA